jgi:sulfur relay (sulfurtransferase) DsrF/TusC family protein
MSFEIGQQLGRVALDAAAELSERFTEPDVLLIQTTVVVREPGGGVETVVREARLGYEI